jgi:hypothetical protein
MSDKTQIELQIDLVNYINETKSATDYRLTKTVSANFIPQHGMQIIVDDIIFVIRTIALAGLTGLKFAAAPYKTKYGFVGQNKQVLFRISHSLPDEIWMQERISHFKKLGWK